MKKSPQQQWNESNPDIILEAKRKYNQKNKIIGIRVSKEEEGELIEWYEGLSKEQKREVFVAVINFLKDYREQSKDLEIERAMR